MKRTVNRWSQIAAAALGLLLTPMAYAGYKAESPVFVDQSSNIALGSLGSARNSADSTQYIGCTVGFSNGAESLSCYARTSTGLMGTCYSSNPTVVALGRSLTPASYLYFTWDEVTQECTYLQVIKNSYVRPMAP